MSDAFNSVVVRLQNSWARLRDREEGQTMVEYGLLIGGIALVVIAGILILGPAINNLFEKAGSSVENFPSS
jgi:pilus assembly protein Flp/PilA